jgi:DNA-binding Xre family transcriptional regulator
LNIEKLKQKLLEKKLNVYELHSLTGISYSTLHDIIVTQKTKNPRVETVKKIASALGEDLGNLI